MSPLPDTKAAVVIRLPNAMLEVNEDASQHTFCSAPCTAKGMLGDITVAENIYSACGYADMRKSIDGLAAVVQESSIWISSHGVCSFSV